MRFKGFLFLMLMCLNRLCKAQLEEADEFDDGDDASAENFVLQLPPYKMEPTYRNPYKPIGGHKLRKKQENFVSTTESLCVRNLNKKKAEEELKNPTKKLIPSGNRWHGPVQYGEYMWRSKKSSVRHNKIRDITPVERKLHKCYKWVNSQELLQYKLPAILQTLKDKDKDLFHIEICCPQYAPIRYMGNTLCRPFCSHCRNGICIAPEKCRCFDGFVLSDNEDCVFTCPISCLNGRCNLLTGSCLCNGGYKLDETGQFCRPICHAGCGINPLHNCTEPQVCGCVKGYSLTDNDCQPIERT